MEKFVTGIARVLAVLAALSTVTLMLAIAVDVVARNVFNQSIPGMIELSETSLVFAVFLGLALAGANNEHVKVTLFTDRLGPKTAHRLRFVAWALSSVTLVWLIYATALRAAHAVAEGESRMGLMSWPLWPARLAIPVGLAALLLIAIVNVGRALKGLKPLGNDLLESLDSDPNYQPAESLDFKPMPQMATVDSSGSE